MQYRISWVVGLSAGLVLITAGYAAGVSSQNAPRASGTSPDIQQSKALRVEPATPFQFSVQSIRNVADDKEPTPEPTLLQESEPEPPSQPEVKRTLKPGQVARVGNNIITAEQLLERLHDLEQGLPHNQRILIPAWTYLMQVQLLELEADAINLKIPAEAEQAWTDDQLVQIKEQVKKNTGGALTWKQWLEQQGMTEEGFISYVKARARTVLLKRVLITHFEQTTDSLDAAHILVKKLSTAKDIHRRLAGGEDFGDLAATHSVDPGAAMTKGRLPRVYAGEGLFIKEVSDALWGLKDGEYSEPVKSEFGWHILKRNRTIPGAVVDFQEKVPEYLKAADPLEDNFKRWVRWVQNTKQHEVERRLPGLDVKADEDNSN
ncbi:MAG: peptidylprolyl isomerase [Nitrospira sp.]|nr:peptidylprolyl isomerase [Nitrospira sp.]